MATWYRLTRYLHAAPSDNRSVRPAPRGRGASARGHRIGGAALALLGVITRQTRDFDILAPEPPSDVVAAARAFAREQRRQGVDLVDDWLNNGPLQLRDVLPAGWQVRVQLAFGGRALVLHTPGRADLLKTKLFALCDRGIDLTDCVAMAPTPDELAHALPWVGLQDANPDWPSRRGDVQ